MNDATLVVDNISVRYGRGATARTVVDHLSFELPAGQIGCLLGASGCGKTTVLRAIAGFEPVSGGEIRIGDRRIASPTAHMPIEHRYVGMMFQDYALFPHLDVAGNVAFGLHNLPVAERRSRVTNLLSLVGLHDRLSSYPHELSGGQQQRVALARALAPSPAVLLLDEPFSNLDGDLREQLVIELRSILKSTSTTALVVTHDQAEAAAISDVIGVMSNGRIEQWAPAAELYHRPANRWVAGFIGRGTVIPAHAIGLPGDGDVLVRPESIVLDDHGQVRATIEDSLFRGPGYRVRLKLPDGPLIEADIDADVAPRPGDQVGLRIDMARLVRFRNPVPDAK